MAICAEQGCPVIVPKGRCPTHTRVRQRAKEARRAPSDARLHTARWTRYSRARLARYPWCVGYPQGVHVIPTLAQVTNHQKPAKQCTDAEFWDPTLHTSLCQDCNKRRGIAEEGGFGQ